MRRDLRMPSRRTTLYVARLLGWVVLISLAGIVAGRAAAASDAVAAIDNAIADTVRHTFRCGSLGVGAAKVLTYVGLPPWFALLLIVVGVVLVRSRQKAAIAYVAATVLGNGAIDTVVKRVVDRSRPAIERPCHYTAFSGEHWSFPSGHSMTSFVMYTMFAVLLIRTLPAWKRGVVVAVTILLPLMIGGARLVLGVHYFSDIAGGLVLGATWSVASLFGFRRWSGRWWPVDKPP